MDKFKACLLHIHESNIVPQGISKGYPTQIDFDILPSRISGLFSTLKSIVNNETCSIYRDHAVEVVKNLGAVKASMPMFMMNRFRDTLVRD